jgi:hypothetical protein
LTVESLTNAINSGLEGSEIFWKQFDVFDLRLCRPVMKSESTPFIRMSAEFHFPPNTPTPEIQNGQVGDFMNEQLLKALNDTWPGILKKWDSGFSGGNPMGFDINFYGYLNERANGLEIPPDDEDVVLFRYEKPLDEPRDRVLGDRIDAFKISSDPNDMTIIGPDGVQKLSDLRKQSKGPLN